MPTSQCFKGTHKNENNGLTIYKYVKARKKSLKLTNKGEKLTILVDGYLNEASDELLSKLNEEERVAFVKILEKLTGKMEVNLWALI